MWFVTTPAEVIRPIVLGFGFREPERSVLSGAIAEGPARVPGYSVICPTVVIFPIALDVDSVNQVHRGLLLLRGAAARGGPSKAFREPPDANRPTLLPTASVKPQRPAGRCYVPGSSPPLARAVSSRRRRRLEPGADGRVAVYRRALRNAHARDPAVRVPSGPKHGTAPFGGSVFNRRRTGGAKRSDHRHLGESKRGR
jgi:hypothetical protein